MYPYGNPSFLARGLSFTRGINWGSLLDGTQKTLGVINQAIPIVYQVRPIIKNAKTMLRIASQMATNDNPSNNKPINNNMNMNNNINNTNTTSSFSSNNLSNKNVPIFYI